MIDYERLALAETHPLRLAILETLEGSQEPLSPNQLHLLLKEGLSKTSYHVTELRKAGMLELVKEVQRRGAMEHYYRVRP